MDFMIKALSVLIWETCLACSPYNYGRRAAIGFGASS